MAEDGRLAGLLGEQAEEEAAGEGVAPGLDASAAAMAMHASRTDPNLSAKAAAYFEYQARLVSIQTEHMHEQREVLLSHLRLKRFGERLRIGSQLFVVVVAALIVACLFVMLGDAITTRAVIVEPFDAPPALAERGLSGKVLAGALLDQLTRLQLAARSSATKRALVSSWSDEIKVEVPETGLSLSDIGRLLKARFGHDLHIGGDLVRGQAGDLELTVRGDGVVPKVFAGAAGDLHRLVVLAGEYVYGQTQPALFAVYLLNSGRNEEAIAFSTEAVLRAPLDERPYLYNAWAGAIGNLGGSLEQAVQLERAALAIKPDYWTAYTNAALDARGLGDEEGAWHLGEAMRRAAGGRPGAAPEMAYTTWDYLTYNLLAERAATIADAEAHAGLGSGIQSASPIIAGLDVDLHDAADASLRLASFDMKDPYAAAIAHWVRGRLAEDAGDTATALAEMEAYDAANANPAVSGGDTSYHCFLAPAEEAAGHPDRADAAIKAGGHFQDCARFRADALDHRGRWDEAQRAYADAVAVAPDLPAAYFSWGAALARHGDLDGAAEKFREAHKRGPHWADPLKALGDLLGRQGHWRRAVDEYDAALAYAPNWVALQKARGEAARQGA